MERYDWPLLAVLLLIALSTFLALRGGRLAVRTLTGLCLKQREKRLLLRAFSSRHYQVLGNLRSRVSRY